jgi:hypothetical protein
MPQRGGPQTTLVPHEFSIVTTLFVSGTTLYCGTGAGAVRSLSPLALGGTVTTHVPPDGFVDHRVAVLRRHALALDSLPRPGRELQGLFERRPGYGEHRVEADPGGPGLRHGAVGGTR